LARHGIEVHVAPFDFSAVALLSNKIKGIHWLPYYSGDGLEWREELRLLIRREHIDLLIPCDERTILPLDHHRHEFAELCKLAIPSSDAIEVLFDKHLTRELARSVGVPIAPGRQLRGQDTAQALIDEVGLPLVLKPRKSFSLDSLHVRSDVRILNDVDAMACVLDGIAANRFIVERFFEGFGVGLSVLAKDGRILQAFQHERVHEAHLTAGSSYRLAVAVDHDLERAVALILQRIRYTGLAMFEFRKNGTNGQYVLLEINARPWGSLPFPVALGVEFPFHWYELLIHNKEVPRVQYRSGVYSRNVSQDFNYFRHKIDRLKSQPWQAASFSVAWLAEFRRYLMGREVWDSLVIDDVRPGLAELTRAVQLAAKHVTKWFPSRRMLRRWRAKRIFAGANRGEGHDLIVFVCHGNICRSPFAALQLERFLDLNDEPPKIMSAGMMALEDRSPPRTAILTGRERGVDIETHRSRHLSRGLAESARVVIVFDDLNRQAVIARYPHLKRVVCLSDLCDGVKFDEIPDPFGQDQATFRATYATITDCNRAIALTLRSLSSSDTSN
jgi:protein-tyrosine-phosphatase/D-alanine-D-alanine ligase-like ATP-grasp enzyme